MTGKRLGINKRVSLVSATTVRTRLMSFPDPLNPRTYFYKAALAACAPDCGSAHINLYFQAVAWERVQLLSPPPFLSAFLIALKLNLWWSPSTSWPSPSIFPVACTPPPSGFLPQTVFETHGRAAPRLMPASPRSERVLQLVDALSRSSSPQWLQRDAARCFDTVRWPHSQRAGGSLLRGGVTQKAKYSISRQSYLYIYHCKKQ